MSRIGKKPIPIPEQVGVELKGKKVKVEGDRGEIEYTLPQEIGVEVEGGELRVEKKGTTKQAQALWGTWAAILKNAIRGVMEGYKKELELVGLGFKAEKKDNRLELQLGFSHPVKIKIPEGIEVETEKRKITISGIDKQLVGATAAAIRSIRPPEPYKGTGVRYVDEQVRRKPGKAAKGLGAEST